MSLDNQDTGMGQDKGYIFINDWVIDGYNKYKFYVVEIRLVEMNVTL